MIMTVIIIIIIMIKLIVIMKVECSGNVGFMASLMSNILYSLKTV